VDGEEKCQSLASWEMVCQPKEKGGLGVMNLKVQNQSLLLKFLDKFYKRRDIPWVQIVWDKYYDEQVPHARPPCGSFWWRDVASLMDIFRGISKCQVRAGDSALLWKDPWTKPPLSENLARLFSFASNTDISVRDFVGETNLGTIFQLPLSMEAHEELLTLQGVMHSGLLEENEPDIWSYVWEADDYKPKDFYSFCFRDIKPPKFLPYIWKSRCTMKHKMFAWLMLVDRINTRDMLRRRHFNIGAIYSCLTCDSGRDETRNHLFFDCDFSSECWAIVGIHWDTGLLIEPMIEKAKERWSGHLFVEAVILVAWNVWKVRNRALFDGVQPEILTWRKQLAEDLKVLRCRIKEKQKGALDTLTSLVTAW
jgi:hypothetical protein